MTVISSIAGLQKWRKSIGSQNVGFVPTMGALHAGHESLMHMSVDENDVTVLSIFVNPTQFNNPDDLKKYPVTLEQDLDMARKAGVDVVFTPAFTDMYPDNYKFKIQESTLSQSLCGEHRPGHFDGVLTVVMKLLLLVQADRAYFGEKDFQQLELVRQMANAFFLSTVIVPCPTVRETDGLAMSSRNRRLSPQGRHKATLISKLLHEGSLSCSEVRTQLEREGFEVDYVKDFMDRRFVAAQIEGVRLIDNEKR